MIKRFNVYSGITECWSKSHRSPVALSARSNHHFNCANPFLLGLSEKDWNGEGYVLKQPYIDEAEVAYKDQDWVYDRSHAGTSIQFPREYRHTLSKLTAGLVEQRFVILDVSDHSGFYPNLNAEPGTWEHFVSIAPPWLSFWASYRPDVLP